MGLGSLTGPDFPHARSKAWLKPLYRGYFSVSHSFDFCLMETQRRQAYKNLSDHYKSCVHRFNSNYQWGSGHSYPRLSRTFKQSLHSFFSCRFSVGPYFLSKRTRTLLFSKAINGDVEENCLTQPCFANGGPRIVHMGQDASR